VCGVAGPDAGGPGRRLTRRKLRGWGRSYNRTVGTDDKDDAMSARLRGIAKETEAIVAAGGYRSPGGREVITAEGVTRAAAGTRAYGPGPVSVPDGGDRLDTVFEVTGESSLAAARRLTDRDAGRLRLEMPDRAVELGPYDVYTVPHGTPHKPVADPGTRILMFEPRGTVNTGDGNEGTTGVRPDAEG
jgi:hypothetical protein